MSSEPEIPTRKTTAKFSAHIGSFANQKGTKSKSDATTGVIHDAWQRKAYEYNDVIPEVGYANQKIADVFSRGVIRILERKETKRGGINQAPTKNKLALKLLQDFTGPFGGHNMLLLQMAQNLNIAGEGYLVGRPERVKGKVIDMNWEFVSVFQIRFVEDKFNPNNAVKVFYIDRNRKEIELDKDTYVARFHRPHPQYSMSADSAMRRNAALCDEIILTTQLIAAITKFKMSAGLFTVSDEMSFGPADETESDAGDGTDIDAMDPFDRQIYMQFNGPAEDPENPAAFIVGILRGPKEYLPTKENYITFDRPFDEMVLRIRDDAIDRVITGMDLPTETVSGKSGTNGWSGFNIDQDLITKHIIPMGQLVENFLTLKWLRPFLIEQGMDPEEAKKYTVFYDSSGIAAKPDLTKTAMDLYDRHVIDVESLRRLSGLEEADAPTEEDFFKQIVLKLSELSPDYASVLLPLLPEFKDVKFPVTPVGNVGGDRDPKDNPTPTGSDTKSAPPAGRNAERRKRSNQNTPDDNSGA